jgi:LPS sulfotransferase NodH
VTTMRAFTGERAARTGAPDSGRAPVGYERFMILSDARTGSNLLVQALNSHPNIVCFREIFNFEWPGVDFNVEGHNSHDADSLRLRNTDPPRFLREQVFGDHVADAKAVGFKFHYDHLWAFEGLVQHLVADEGLRVIHLVRRNALRSLVSRMIADQTGRWFEYGTIPLRDRVNVRTLRAALRDPRKAWLRLRETFSRKRDDTPTPAADKRVMISVEDCRKHFERLDRIVPEWDAMFARHPKMIVVYEDLVVDGSGLWSDVQTFLGVEPMPLSLELQKQNPEPLAELIANYEELKSAFAATPWSAFFE